MDRLRGILENPQPNRRPDFDTLSGGYTAASGTVSLTNANTLWKRGNILEFADGLQLLATADGTGGSVAVEVWRGSDGNQSSGDLVRRNPLYAYLEMSEAIDEVIRNYLWPHVWTWHNDSLTFTPGTTTYDLDAYIVDVVRVYQYNINGNSGFFPIARNWFDTESVINTAVSTNQNMLRLRQVHDASFTVYYEAKRRPDVADLANFDARLDDLVVRGAAALIMEGTLASEQVDRSRRANRSDNKATADSRVHTARFFTMREQVKADLRSEIRMERKAVPLTRRSW